MKKMNFLKIACAAALSAACCFAAVGCSQTKSDSGDVSVNDTSEGVAATVNGTEIGEKAVTSYIANFRSMSNLESDADWAQWLVDNNYTAADIREEVINYYASQELIRQAAEENDIKVESSEIDSQVQQMRSYYDSDEDWENALKQIGTTESQYRSLLEISMLQQALQEKVRAFADLPGVSVLTAAERDGHVDLSDLLQQLAKKDVTSVLVEGGSDIHGAFFDAGLVERVYAFIAPSLIGGNKSRPAIGGQGASTMEQKVTLQEVTTLPLEPDLLVTGLTRKGV